MRQNAQDESSTSCEHFAAAVASLSIGRVRAGILTGELGESLVQATQTACLLITENCIWTSVVLSWVRMSRR